MDISQWIEHSGTHAVLAIGGAVVGLGFGFLAQRSKFCLRAATIEFWRGQFGEKLAIWVTGHSLGGALATLMAAEILRRIDAGAPLELRGVYTFGSPRVGDRAFRARLAATAAKHGTQLVRVLAAPAASAERNRRRRDDRPRRPAGDQRLTPIIVVTSSAVATCSSVISPRST